MANRPIPGTRTANLGRSGRPARLGRLGHAPRRSQIRNLKGTFSSGWGFNWIGLDEVAKLFDLLDTVSSVAVPHAMREIGEKSIEWAKQNARWEDRTGEARGLDAPHTDEAHLHYAITEEPGGGFSLHLAHGQYYGVFLEADPDYAILAEALIRATDMSPKVTDKMITAHLGRAAR